MQESKCGCEWCQFDGMPTFPCWPCPCRSRSSPSHIHFCHGCWPVRSNEGPSLESTPHPGTDRCKHGQTLDPSLRLLVAWLMAVSSLWLQLGIKPATPTFASSPLHFDAQRINDCRHPARCVPPSSRNLLGSRASSSLATYRPSPQQTRNMCGLLWPFAITEFLE